MFWLIETTLYFVSSKNFFHVFFSMLLLFFRCVFVQQWKQRKYIAFCMPCLLFKTVSSLLLWLLFFTGLVPTFPRPFFFLLENLLWKLSWNYFSWTLEAKLIRGFISRFSTSLFLTSLVFLILLYKQSSKLATFEVGNLRNWWFLTLATGAYWPKIGKYRNWWFS